MNQTLPLNEFRRIDCHSDRISKNAADAPKWQASGSDGEYGPTIIPDMIVMCGWPGCQVPVRLGGSSAPRTSTRLISQRSYAGTGSVRTAESLRRSESADASQR